MLLLVLSGGEQEHPQEDIICPFPDTDYAKKSKEEVLRKKKKRGYDSLQGRTRLAKAMFPLPACLVLHLCICSLRRLYDVGLY